MRSDIRPGTAIGKGLDWLKWSKAQVSKLRPSATVIAIGANEGWPQKTPAGETVECCGEAWEDEFVRRIRVMMKTYLRRGDGSVVWLTLPAPKGDAKTAIFEAVNRAIMRAGDEHAAHDHPARRSHLHPRGLPRDDALPRRDRPRARARRHPLNVAGTAIAAKEIARALRELR